MPAPFTRNDSIQFRVTGVEIQHLAAIGTIPGVKMLEAAARNMPGAGRIRSTDGGTRLSWRAPGSSTYGDQEFIDADKVIQLEDGEDATRYVRIQVYKSWLSPQPAGARVYLADRYENGVGHDDVTASEASNANVVQYTLTIANVNPGTKITNLDAWFEPDTPFHLEMRGGTGAAWVAPTTEADALRLSDIEIGGSIPLYIRRVIGAGEPSDPKILAWIRTVFDAL